MRSRRDVVFERFVSTLKKWSRSAGRAWGVAPAGCPLPKREMLFRTTLKKWSTFRPTLKNEEHRLN
eukprot:6064637-Prymnesium_polylepis.1